MIMAALIPYLVKVILISAILFAYYYLVLRDRNFHRYNRIYLLCAVILSLVLPLIKIGNLFTGNAQKAIPQFVNKYVVLEPVVVDAQVTNTASVYQALCYIYLLVAAVILTLFIVSLLRIYRIKRRGAVSQVDNFTIIRTNSPDAPFSFFSWIFLSPLSENSMEGSRILRHELVHVKQGHTFDKLLISLVTVMYWFNPFIWLIKKELYMVHEFLADQSAFDDGDTRAFSQLTFQTIFPGHTLPLTNRFFYSPLKRRLTMILKNKHQKVSYFWRIMALPVSAVIMIAFSVNVNAEPASSAVIGETQDITAGMDQQTAGTRIETNQSDPASHRSATQRDTIPLDRTVKPPPPPPLPAPSVPIAPPPPPSPQEEYSAAQSSLDTIPGDDKVFTKVEREAQFPGGAKAWTEYIVKAIQANLDSLSTEDYGTCVVKFIVSKTGEVSNVEAMTMRDSKLARIAVNAIENGPKWIPAQQSGRYVNAFRLQPVTLKNPQKK